MYDRRVHQPDQAMTNHQPDANGFYSPNSQPPHGQSQPPNHVFPSQQQQPQPPPPPSQQQPPHPRAHGVPMHQQQPFRTIGSKMDDPYASYAPRNMSPTNSQTPSQQNGFFNVSSYAQDPMHQHQQQMPPPPQQSQYYSNQQYHNTDHATPPQNALQSSYSSNYNLSMSPQASPTMTRLPTPPISHQEFATLEPAGQAQHRQSHQHSSFYEMQQQQQQQQQQQYQSHQQQQQQQQYQPQIPNMQSAVPFMLAGMQQMASNGPGNGFNAALGAQLFNSLAPGAAGYTSQFFGQQQDGRTFMRMPKYYFAVNHRYVLKKLAIIVMPFAHRIWSRRRGMDPVQFEGSTAEGVATYLPPRDDVNAPDLYIPLMSFVTYVLMVGFVFGIRNDFHANVLAKYFSKGLGVLSLEVLIVKLGLYLVNARPTPWLDIIAYRGYKFVGVVVAMASWLLMPRLYLPVLLYAASAMAIFLMRSHRRIILPRDVNLQQTTDLARRNGFLLFLSVLQYPIYWMLVLGPSR